MTEKEAMEIIMQVAYDGEFPLNSNEAFGIACRCIQKHIPKKPLIATNLMTKHVSVHCSICDTDITYYSSEENYCPKCGQAIKWE